MTPSYDPKPLIVSFFKKKTVKAMCQYLLRDFISTFFWFRGVKIIKSNLLKRCFIEFMQTYFNLKIYYL